MQHEGSAGAQAPALAKEQQNRCPYHRELSSGFRGCPAFQPAEYITVDFKLRATRPVWTCRYLDVGEGGEGEFFPSCAIGDARSREEWAARLREDRRELFRSLQVELGEAIRPHVLELLEAKARRLEQQDPLHPEDDAEVGELVRLAMLQVNAVLGLRRAELRVLGVPVGACRDLVRWILLEIGRRDDYAFPAIPPGRLAGLPDDVAELLGAFRG